jgi:uncharacterized protein (DUF697 family)
MGKPWRMSRFVPMAAADVLTLMRKRSQAHAVYRDVKKPFRFFLCGDPALVAEFRATLLSGHPGDHIPLDAAATLETLVMSRAYVAAPDAKLVVFLGRPGDRAGARLDLLQPLRLPIFAITVDPDAPPAMPATPPLGGAVGDYVVPRLDRDALRTRVFGHMLERCKGIEIAVGRRLPAMREAAAAKLTRDAASSALKVAAASAVVDHVPLLGVVIGAVVSAGDMVAITGIQIVLMMQIGAVYGHEPDVSDIWELLPVVGGGFGWRMLSRELSGFIPVAGIAIKGAIAYAGTIVVGEGVSFYYEQGRHMTKAQAAQLYLEMKRSAMGFARETYMRLRRRPPQ